MGMLPPVFVELRANISEFSTKMGEARGEIEMLQKQGASNFDKLAAVGKTSLLAVGTAAIAVGGMSVHMADQFEESHAKLETAIKNTGGSYEEYQNQIKKATDSQAALGFNATETEAGLAKLTTALGDPKKALDSLSIASDLARYKNVSLEDASLAVARAQEGNLKPLKQLGIDLPIAATNALKLEKANQALTTSQENLQKFLEANPKAMQANSAEHKKYLTLQADVAKQQATVNSMNSTGKDVMDGLAKAIGGQAAAQTQTLGGQMKVLKSETENAFIAIGMKLIPALLESIKVFKEAWHWASEHKGMMEALGGIIGGALLVAIGAYIASMAAAAVATIAAAAPFIALGAVIYALIVIFKDLYDHSDQILKSITDNFVKFKDGVVHIFDDVKNAFVGIWHGIGDVVGVALSAVGNVVKGYFNLWIGLFNHIIDLLNKIQFDIPKIGPFGGGHFGVNIPNIPFLADGGIVTMPTVAMVGEAGPEAVIPLNKMGDMSGMSVNITVQGSVVQERDLAVTVRDNIAQLMRRRGLNPNILGV